MIWLQVPAGSITYTPEQQQWYKKNKEREERAKLINKANSNLGRYYFVRSDNQFLGLRLETVTRLIYLGTYLGIGSDALMVTRRRAMRKDDLPEILMFSDKTVSRFWSEVYPDYLSEDDNGGLHLVSDMFVRGQLPRKGYMPFQKFYNEGVRELYSKVSVRDHKRLGYVFRVLPYLNRQFNFVCSADCVEETALEDICLMTAREFCGAIGYAPSHFKRLRSFLLGIKLNFGGKAERLCTMEYTELDEAVKVWINPHVFYSGTNWEAVETLGCLSWV